MRLCAYAHTSIGLVAIDSHSRLARPGSYAPMRIQALLRNVSICRNWRGVAIIAPSVPAGTPEAFRPLFIYPLK